MENKSSNRIVVWILIAIIIILAIALAFLYGRNNSPTAQPAQEIPATESTTSATTTQPVAIQPTVPAAPSGYKTYNSASYGISFNYPTAWTLTQDASKKTVTVTSNTNYVQGTYSIPLEKITFTSTDKNYFNPPINTKYGSIAYDATLKSLVDIGETPARCMPADHILGSGSIKGITFSGSSMSDPAYHTSAIITTNGPIILVDDESESTPDQPERQEAASIVESLSLLNGNTTAYPACALQGSN